MKFSKLFITPVCSLFIKLRKVENDVNNAARRLASMAGAVIEATARPDLEDFLRTRSPGEVVWD